MFDSFRWLSSLLLILELWLCVQSFITWDKPPSKVSGDGPCHDDASVCRIIRLSGCILKLLTANGVTLVTRSTEFLSLLIKMENHLLGMWK